MLFAAGRWPTAAPDLMAGRIARADRFAVRARSVLVPWAAPGLLTAVAAAIAGLADWRTVVLVSHDAAQVNRLCSHVLNLDVERTQSAAERR